MIIAILKICGQRSAQRAREKSQRSHGAERPNVAGVERASLAFLISSGKDYFSGTQIDSSEPRSTKPLTRGESNQQWVDG
jgi:hypothetical protein